DPDRTPQERTPDPDRGATRPHAGERLPPVGRGRREESGGERRPDPRRLGRRPPRLARRQADRPPDSSPGDGRADPDATPGRYTGVRGPGGVAADSQPGSEGGGHPKARRPGADN